MRATEKFISDLWFVETAASDQQATVPDRITLGAPPYGEETDATLACLHILLGEALLRFSEGARGAALALSQQFEIPSSVFFVAQP